MPNEDNRFGDVAEQLKQTEDDEASAEESNRREQRANGSPDRPHETPPGRVDNGEERTSDEPAFSFDETEMHGFYVRNGTWARITRMRSSVTAVCSMFDVPAFEGREFQDACLRVIAEHGDEVALQILQERGIDADEERISDVMQMLNDKSDDE